MIPRGATPGPPARMGERMAGRTRPPRCGVGGPKRFVVLAVLALGGCQANDNFFTGPTLTPVGHGLTAQRAPLPMAFEVKEPRAFGTIGNVRTTALFTDIRAGGVGDTVTVLINLNDLAQFDNETNRLREADVDFDFFGLIGGNDFAGNGGTASAEAALGIGSETEFLGRGAIDRRERLRVRLAAVVTDRLPNGNLFISGTQEIKVNNELRVLTVAGIVRQLDVNSDNTIPFDKIAEARISYDGRGRLNDVQRPAWGQLIYDAAVPF